MLSEQEKKEMLEDAKSDIRRQHFRANRKQAGFASFDEYIVFLNSVQRIFSPFKISDRPMIAKLNKL